MRDAALGSHRVVAPHNGDPGGAERGRPAREHPAVLQRVLAGQEGDHGAEIGAVAEICGEVGEALLLRVAGRVVGEQHEGALPGEALDRVVHVDPEIHAARGVQAAAGRPELDGGHRAGPGEAGGEAGAPSGRRAIPVRVPGTQARHHSVPKSVGSPAVSTSAPSSVISTSSSIRIPVPFQLRHAAGSSPARNTARAPR